MNVAFLTDIHLNDREPVFMKRKRIELLKDFVKNKTDGLSQVVFGGDIFDSVNVDTSSEIANFFFKEVVAPLIQKQIKVDIIVGNHEKLGRKNVYKLFSNELTTNLLDIHQEINYRIGENYAEIFVPYVYFSELGVETIEDANLALKSKIEAFLSEIKGITDKPVILYNHNCMGDVWFDIEKETNLEVYKIEGIDLVLGGHIHKHKKLANNAYYVGGFMRSFVYEEESEGYMTFSVENNEIKTEYHPLESYHFEKITLSDDEIYNFLPNYVYTITYKLNNPKDPFYVNNIKKRCFDSGAYIIRENHEKINVLPKEKEKHVNIIQSNEDILKTFLKEKNIKNDELKDYLIKLALCSSPQKFGSIADAKSAVDISDIEEMTIRKSRKIQTKKEKKDKEVLKKLQQGQKELINTNYLL